MKVLAQDITHICQMSVQASGRTKMRTYLKDLGMSQRDCGDNDEEG
jgi:hypothetical protein